jgi:hypothetical protein
VKTELAKILDEQVVRSKGYNFATLAEGSLSVLKLDQSTQYSAGRYFWPMTPATGGQAVSAVEQLETFAASLSPVAAAKKVAHAKG